ncbi:hypothetical protein KHA80_05145 [Anaerobacillus sp. HL2]|nr:hypothetical protein KHA80_05145 [Anaerobacillus sp. HL2]
MTISRKDRMLSIISKLEPHTPEMTDELRDKIMEAERKLQQMSDIEVEKMTDNVFSAPASETKLWIRVTCEKFTTLFLR